MNIQKVIETIVKETWLPALVTLVEVLAVAGIICLITTFVPHTLEIIKLNYVTWLVVTCVVRLLFYRSKVSDDLTEPPMEEEVDSQPDDDETVSEIVVPMMDTQTMPPPEPPRAPSPVNVRPGLYPFSPQENDDKETSTRE